MSTWQLQDAKAKLSELIDMAMVTAIARVHGYTIATRNIRDFQPFGVAVVDSF